MPPRQQPDEGLDILYLSGRASVPSRGEEDEGEEDRRGGGIAVFAVITIAITIASGLGIMVLGVLQRLA